jgi:hypothetical protein
MKPAALLATMLLMAACGSGPTASVGSPSPSSNATPSPTTSPAPLGLCSPSNRCLALVTLRGSNSVVVRDLTDINHPGTVSTWGPRANPQFVSSTDLSYVDGPSLMRAPVTGPVPTTVVARLENGRWLLTYTWSPDGTTAAMVVNSDASSEVDTAVEGQVRKFSSMPAFNGGCETRACGDTSDFRLLYSPDGGYISMIQNLGGLNFQLWTKDGALAASNPPGTGYNMSVWSGDGLYFVGPGGVSYWRKGTTSSFLPGVQWIRPKASPAGGQIVYMARDSHSLSHVYVVDTNTKKAREIKSGRSNPVFLTPRYLWYKGERVCSTCDPTGSLPVTDTGTTYIYDLETGVESTSIITNVFDAWPHAA